MRRWNTGDNVNLAIGQGDLQATPLQLAVAYSTLATDGRVPRRTSAWRSRTPAASSIQRIERAPARRVKIDEAARAVIMDGLNAAAMEDGGTSHDVFTGWPKDLPVYGKTGTAQRTGKADQSWYAALRPRRPRRSPIVVAATVEECGCFGAEAAAPITRLILSQSSGQEEVRRRGVEHAVNTVQPPTAVPAPAARRPAPAAGPAAHRRRRWGWRRSRCRDRGATQDDVPGSPTYYLTRQAVFFAVGPLILVVISRLDYSRLRELKYVVYGFMLVLILAVLGFGSVARGSRRAIDLPFFQIPGLRARQGAARRRAGGASWSTARAGCASATRRRAICCWRSSRPRS